MIKNLIFDFGKVLVDYDYMPVIRRFFNNDNAEAIKFSKTILTEKWGKIIDKEEEPFSQIISNMQKKHPEYSRQLQMFGDCYPEFVTGEIHGMANLLNRLKNNGYKLYGLSNWCSKVNITIKQYKIFNLLDGYVVSSQVKEIKPDAAIYQHLFKKYSLNPAECFFADDRRENIIGAKAVGMDGVVFIDAAQYENVLRKIGIKL